MPRRIVLVNCTGDTFTPTRSGAIATFTHELAKAGRRAGSHVDVITRSASEPAFPLQGTKFVHYPELRGGRTRRRLQKHLSERRGYPHELQWLYNAKVREALREVGGGESVLIFNNDFELAAQARVWFPGARVGHLLHSSIAPRRRFRSAFTQIHFSMAVSKATATWIDTTLNLREGTTRIVHGGVDLERFRPLAARNATPVLNYVGLLNSGKGVDILLAAAEILAKAGHHFRVQVIGGTLYGGHRGDAKDPYVNDLILAAERLKALGIDVLFRGYLPREQVPTALRATDINVIPSRVPEAFALVALEGMASGCATVASRVGGLPESVGEGGRLFEPGDAVGCAEAIARLLQDAKELAASKQRARLWAEGFSWDESWRQLHAAVKAASP